MDLFGDLPDPTSDSDNQFSKPESPKSEQVKRKLSDVDEDVNDSTPSSKNLITDLHKLQGYHAESKGERGAMQDASVMIDNYLPYVEGVDPSVYRLAYYGVFDGHGGSRAAKHSAENLHKILAEKFPKGEFHKVETDIRKCFIETFKKADEDFLKEASKMKPSWKDGTTAVTVLTVNNTLYVANLGDSKVVLCRYNKDSNRYCAIALTKDHNPALYEERIRIQKAGGTVRDGRVMGVLEVSRSIGDGPYKKHGVICLPDIKRCQLTPQDKFILVACDGLWKTFTHEAAIEFINNVLEDSTIEGTDVKSQDDVKWETACVRLVGEAVRRLSADNVTVVLVRIVTTQQR